MGNRQQVGLVMQVFLMNLASSMHSSSEVSWETIQAVSKDKTARLFKKLAGRGRKREVRSSKGG